MSENHLLSTSAVEKTVVASVKFIYSFNLSQPKGKLFDRTTSVVKSIFKKVGAEYWNSKTCVNFMDRVHFQNVIHCFVGLLYCLFLAFSCIQSDVNETG